MGFSGKLGPYRLADILHVLAEQGESGRLRLTRAQAQGLILLKRGRVIFAASSSYRETLGNLLLTQGRIRPDHLERAVALGREQPNRRLGAILVEMGALGQAELEAAIRQQIERVIDELLPWEAGYFELDPMEMPERPEVEIDARELVPAPSGGAPAAAELGRRLAAEAPATPPPAGALPSGDGAAVYRARLSALKAAMREIQSPEFTGEVTLRLMNFAQRVVQRGVLFVALDQGYAGMGQFGLELGDGADPNQRVRSLLVSSTEPSILREAAERKEAYRARVPAGRADERLLAGLGDGPPREAVAIPMVVSGRVLMVLYGDSPPPAPPIGPVEELELLILQAGLVMEKTLLEKRLAHHARLRSTGVLDGGEA